MDAGKPLKPFLKWAGGKTQLLSAIVQHVPPKYGLYIEPFVGGGAVFFHLRPREAVISDANPELMNCYRVVRDDVDALVELLFAYPYDRDFYYELRKQRPSKLTPIARAARLIYLNKTCYNGLYRVNKQGEFNVPFGLQRNPKICDRAQLKAASQALRDVVIEEGGYCSILAKYARTGDFVYLDPPYYPVSAYADFNRFIKEFFYEEDHVELALELKRLVEMGVWVLLTNSNTEFTRRLYQQFPYEIIDTRRNISCNGTGRGTGQDLIVFATKATEKTARYRQGKSETLTVLEKFPGTRFMGSKYNVLDFIWDSVKNLNFNSVLDAFCGSACVSYLFKVKGKQVYSNDFLHFCYHTANALVANNGIHLTEDDLAVLLSPDPRAATFVQDTFQGLYFSDQENVFLDQVRGNIDKLQDSYKRSLAISALVRACLKKRPRGIFTYVGERYYDDRRDLQMELREHFIEAVREYNRAVFDNHLRNVAFNEDTFELDIAADLVYLDPPYYSPYSDSDYVRRYHFVEGLVRYWQGVKVQMHAKTRKFKKYPTAFDGKKSTYEAFPRLFEKFRNSIIVVSYSSNGLPAKSELAYMLKQFKRRVSVLQITHRYSFGTQYEKALAANNVEEYIFVGT